MPAEGRSDAPALVVEPRHDAGAELVGARVAEGEDVAFAILPAGLAPGFDLGMGRKVACEVRPLLQDAGAEPPAEGADLAVGNGLRRGRLSELDREIRGACASRVPAPLGRIEVNGDLVVTDGGIPCQTIGIGAVPCRGALELFVAGLA